MTERFRGHDLRFEAGDDGFEAARAAILAQALELAAFDGWTLLMLRRAGAAAGVTATILTAAFPAGIADLLEYWSDQSDGAMRTAMTGPEFVRRRIREKVAFAVKARFAALAPHKEAARRGAATLALPPYARLALRLSWRTADAIWRGLGDKSADFNFYSKRMILAGVWTSTFARWLADDSEDGRSTADFLDDRIGDVMQFEKLKAQVRDLGLEPGKAVAALARLRYPA